MADDRKRLEAFTVRERGEKSWWVRIGSAWTNRDGSITVRLDALPLDGVIQLREPKEGAK